MKFFLKTIILMFVAVFLISESAMALPTEWGVINPTNLIATDAEMVNVMESWIEDNSAPAYFIWTEDEDRTEWNIAWTGDAIFSGTIALQNATADGFETVDFENTDLSFSDDSTFASYLSLVSYNDKFDGITFTIDEYTLPSYVGFDLFCGGPADPNNIFLGLDMETVASLGEDQDFAIAAPVPEPATLFLLGSGLLGFAGLRRKKFKK